MTANATLRAVDYAALDDAALAALLQRGDRAAFRELMQRSNRRLFRVARGVLGSDAEAEDVVQESYMEAYANLAGFRGEASLLTWLTRIVLNAAYGRLRRQHSQVEVEQIEAAQLDPGRIVAFPGTSVSIDPAAAVAQEQIRRLIEKAVDALPEPFRIVFVLREIEGCTVEETATALSLRSETVKTRLHRARRLLHAALSDTLATTLNEAFPFLGTRCERMTETVMQRIAALPDGSND